jgi:hypothetical protein
MNLWVNRLRQLALLAVALFFFACEDETSLNGFRNPNQKINVKYADIPLTTSNLLLDKIRTSNNLFQNEYGRFMVGQYNDPELGKVRSHAVTQFFTSSGSKLPATATITGITIDLAFDLYTYGSKTESNQTISIYEVAEPISSSRKRTAYSNTVIPWNTDRLIAEKQFGVNPALFKEFLELNSNSSTADDTTVTVSFNVIDRTDLPDNEDFYNRLISSFTRYSTNEADAFVDFSEFSVDFPGLAFVSSGDNNMIMGFSTASASRMVIHFDNVVNGTTTKGTQSLLFSFPGLFSYNKIETERTGEIAGIMPHQDQPTTQGNRYVEGATGLVTKLNIDNFFTYMDENNLKNVQLNSAQLIIDGVPTSDFAPPRGLALRVLKEDNYLRKLIPEDEQEKRDSTLFSGLISSDFQISSKQGTVLRGAIFDDDSVYYAVNDGNSPVALAFESAKGRYSGFLTLLFQRLYKEKDNITRIHDFVIYPSDPATPNYGAKSVNRVMFPSDKVTLRIFYSEPTVNQD